MRLHLRKGKKKGRGEWRQKREEKKGREDRLTIKLLGGYYSQGLRKGREVGRGKKKEVK